MLRPFFWPERSGAMTAVLASAAFPEVLARTLQERGLALVDVARRTGISVGELQELADGSRAPSHGFMEIIARGLGDSPSIFVEYRVDCVIESFRSSAS